MEIQIIKLQFVIGLHVLDSSIFFLFYTLHKDLRQALFLFNTGLLEDVYSDLPPRHLEIQS